jgi:hypothetical protein
VEDPEVDAPMKGWALAALLVVVLLAMSLLPGPGGVPGARAAPAKPVSGSIVGKTVLGYDTSGAYTINGTGGPGVAANGTIIGNLSFYVSVAGTNTSGVTVSPDSGKVLNGIPGSVSLAVTNVSQVLTLNVLLASTLNSSNASTNFSIQVTVVQPYVLSTTIYNLGNATVSSFVVLIDLDGSPVGNQTVPTMAPHGTYLFEFKYPTVGLSTGSHTFTVSLTTVHGLIRFANGTTVYSVTFDIPGPPPSYTLWYVAGVAAYLGALFIFGALVGARRRGASKK